jgi:hypothetical protein
LFTAGLYSLLSTSAPLARLLGTPATRSDRTTGIFAEQIPEATPLPAMAYAQIAGNSDVTMDGVSGFQTARLSFRCFAMTYGDAKTLATALRAVLDGLQTTLPDGTQVDLAARLLEEDEFDYDAFQYFTTIDFEFSFREPAA